MRERVFRIELDRSLEMTSRQRKIAGAKFFLALLEFRQRQAFVVGAHEADWITR